MTIRALAAGVPLSTMAVLMLSVFSGVDGLTGYCCRCSHTDRAAARFGFGCGGGAVLNVAFASLEVGSEVRFVDEEGEKGPQASTVRPVGKHHPV